MAHMVFQLTHRKIHVLLGKLSNSYLFKVSHGLHILVRGKDAGVRLRALAVHRHGAAGHWNTRAYETLV